MKKLYSLTTLILLASLSLKAQITATGIPVHQYSGDINSSYDLGPTSPSHTDPDIQNRDLGTNYYFNFYNYPNATASRKPFYFRINNIWNINIRWTFEQYNGYHYGYRLVEPAISNETDPPCYGKWEVLDDNGNSTGDFFYMTLTGTCSMVNNASPPPVNATVITPNSVSLPQLYNTDINAMVNPQPGSMIWSLDDTCVQVYNGSSWNCL